MGDDIKSKFIIFSLVFMVSGGAKLHYGFAQTEGQQMVSQEELQRCVEQKKLEARKAGRPDYDIMDFRYKCYNELMRAKK